MRAAQGEACRVVIEMSHRLRKSDRHKSETCENCRYDHPDNARCRSKPGAARRSVCFLQFRHWTFREQSCLGKLGGLAAKFLSNGHDPRANSGNWRVAQGAIEHFLFPPRVTPLHPGNSDHKQPCSNCVVLLPMISF